MAVKNRPIYFKMYLQDHLYDSRIPLMTMEQRGILYELKIRQFADEDCSLPDDPTAILSYIGQKPESQEALSNVHSCLEPSAKHVLGACFDVLQKFFVTSENHPGKIYEPKLREQWLSYES